MTKQNPIEVFLDARPYYSREHVEEIATFAAGESIPFCRECKDWHPTDEPHSEAA